MCAMNHVFAILKQEPLPAFDPLVGFPWVVALFLPMTSCFHTLCVYCNVRLISYQQTSLLPSSYCMSLWKLDWLEGGSKIYPSANPISVQDKTQCMTI
ncbi:hypothetical protein XELAEV_18034454mg [Xenopus laevis]|uniref:Uncharacterized protein n=1 Tax=Xenopus laevis TaxID=8355 RepID=A0A974HB42_XENLA|nr:hypothetical protein XELAEV_18034454mg [Xenopus laevis]